MQRGSPMDRVDVETSSDVVNHNILLRVIHVNISTVQRVSLCEDDSARISNIADLRIFECFRVAVCASRQELERKRQRMMAINRCLTLTFRQSPGRKPQFLHPG